MTSTIDLYDIEPRATARWFSGDQYPRALVRQVLRPFRPRPLTGLAKVTKNLCLGLDSIGQPYRLHSKADRPSSSGPVGILSGPISDARRVARAQRCVTGVGILNFPEDWPNLFEETKAAFHLQASEWTAEVHRRLFGNKVRVWPVGIDTQRFAPTLASGKVYDFLIYRKILWPQQLARPSFVDDCKSELDRRGLSHVDITYGRYREEDYRKLLFQCRGMLFLCEHESQGIAYGEALSTGVPILAWNQGRWLDPGRHAYGLGEWPATSVPYWDERCGEKFVSLADFPEALDRFLLRREKYQPRDFVMENLTLEGSARSYLRLLEEAASAP